MEKTKYDVGLYLVIRKTKNGRKKEREIKKYIFMKVQKLSKMVYIHIVEPSSDLLLEAYKYVELFLCKQKLIKVNFGFDKR